jgi:hypothetical protein
MTKNKLSNQGHYDPDAPKFRYERDAFGFTRKTTRVRKGEDLVLNQESVPSFKKRKGSLYPWTKPMLGWRRVYVGKGRWIHKGSTSRKKKPDYLAKTIKPGKFKFIKLPSTYGMGVKYDK